MLNQTKKVSSIKPIKIKKKVKNVISVTNIHKNIDEEQIIKTPPNKKVSLQKINNI